MPICAIKINRCLTALVIKAICDDITNNIIRDTISDIIDDITCYTISNIKIIIKSHHWGGGIPVEAEAVQTLFAWLVNRVESGAGILLLSAIWTPTAPSDPLNYCLVTSEPLPFLPRGPGSVGSVSSSDSDITHV